MTVCVLHLGAESLPRRFATEAAASVASASAAAYAHDEGGLAVEASAAPWLAARDEKPRSGTATIERPVPESEGPTAVLSQLPGSEQRSHEVRYDGKARTWLWMVSLRVPATASMVADFYQRALQDAGLKTWTEGETDEGEGPASLIIEGRSPRRSAQVNIRQRPRVLSTEVRLMWRWWEPRPEPSAQDTVPPSAD